VLSAALLAVPAAARTSGAPSADSSGEAGLKDFAPAKFPAVPVVDNRWFPWVPGTRLVLDGHSKSNGKRGRHRIIATVTDLTKVIDGVRTIVVWERDIHDGKLEESAIHFDAQDVDGNVWLLGENPAAYPGGKFKRMLDVWVAGRQGAQPGVLMRADPRTGTSSYFHGLAPKVEYSDKARVAAVGGRTCVPAGCYDDVLKVEEWDPTDPKGGTQLKYYAPGIGNVRVGARHDPDNEVLALSSVRQLGPDGMAEARAAALDLEKHAYEDSKVYRQTPPLETCTPDGQCTRAAEADDAGQVELKDFNPASFPAIPRVDNKWFPLAPGTQLVLEGHANAEGQRGKHQIVATVTDLTKVIDGVRTVVVWEKDVQGGQIQESEINFNAQDIDGNAWLLGEYPAEYAGGKFKRAPDVWISGVAGARPGVNMRADPRPGTSSYFQGLAPAIDFNDKAKVAGTGGHTCVPADCYRDVLKIKEWNPHEPKEGFQLKYYAPGVGNIRVGAVGGKDKEVLVLRGVRQLDAAGLAEARTAALGLERHAYEGSKAYKTTTPLELCAGDGQCTPAR
jgi:hypothetical protein